MGGDRVRAQAPPSRDGTIAGVDGCVTVIGDEVRVETRTTGEYALAWVA